MWAFLAALEVDGVLTTGVVSSPALGSRFWASAGSGAWGGSTSKPPRRRSVSATTELTGARATFALPPGTMAPAAGPGFLDLAKRVRSGDGEPALSVATGRSDLGFKSAGGPWDLAAFAVIVEEAGGRYTDARGGDSIDVAVAVVSNGALHDEILAALAAEPRVP